MRLIDRLWYQLNLRGLRLTQPDPRHLNAQLLREVKEHAYDMIWIDKSGVLTADTLRKVKEIQPKCILVQYMIDDFMNLHHKTKNVLECILVYDYYIVNRFANIDELRSYGCKHPMHVFMSYESNFHYPRTITDAEQQQLTHGADLGLIGTYERERAESINYLANQGIKICIWGDAWHKLKNLSPNLLIQGRGLYDDNFCKAIGAFRINLAFLRKKSRDFHTTRSSEIPACGGFMLAERTDEHLSMFDEGKEAAFFVSNEELLEKCRYYLSHEDERAAGRQRCITSDYSNEGLIKRVMEYIINDRK